MKYRSCAILVAFLVITSLLFSGCGIVKVDNCPNCSAAADFARDTFCPNCGMAYSEIVPDGYKEPLTKNTHGIELIGAWTGSVDEGTLVWFFYPDYSFEVLGKVDGYYIEVINQGKYTIDRNVIKLDEEGWNPPITDGELEYVIEGDFLTIEDYQYMRIGTSLKMESDICGHWLSVFPDDRLDVGYGDDVDCIYFYQDRTVKVDEGSMHGEYEIVHDGEAIYMDLGFYDGDGVLELDMRINGVMRLIGENGLISVFCADKTEY